MSRKPVPGNGYKIAAIALLIYGLFTLVAVAVPAFFTAASTGIVSVLICIGCIVGSIACWRKYKAIIHDYVRTPPADDVRLTEPQSEKAPLQKESEKTDTNCDMMPVKKAEPEGLPVSNSLDAAKVPSQFKKASETETLNKSKPTTKKFNIAGVTNYQKEIESIGYENSDFDLTKSELIEEDLVNEKIYRINFEPIKTELIPEPENPYDKNAIKVIVDGVHVGYIKKGSCAHVKNLLSSDMIEKISCEIHGGKYKILYSDYDEEKDKDVYTLEKEESPYFVTIEITLK